MYVVELVALACAKSWSPSNSNDVPSIPSNPVNSASPISVTSDVSFSNCHDSVALGRITKEPLTNMPNIESEIILTVGSVNTPSSTLGSISRRVTLLKRNKFLRIGESLEAIS